MSSKKDKLIEEAQKFALRGQMDKAIKAYRQVIVLDPSAINQRQRLGDLLIKAGSIEEALIEFETIGKYYSANGFYLKAIAVYKKLQMLLPSEISITLTLADLNEKHGLVANALSEYKQAYEHYKNASDNIAAIKILERMHNVDKQNVGIKLMLAESYFQSGKKGDSYTAFAELASMLYEHGDNSSCIKLNDRIKQLFPEKSDFMYEVLAKQVAEGNVSNAVSAIQALLQQNPNDKRFWELIVKAFRRLDEPQRVKRAYQHYLKFFPTELAAQKGVMESLLNEQDVSGTLALLDHYEQGFMDSGAAADIVSLYKALDQIDPINRRILTGLERACRAAGDLVEAEAIASKLESLTSFSTKKAAVQQTDQFGDIPELFGPEFSDEPTVSSDKDVSVIEKTEPLLTEKPEEIAVSEPEEIEIEIDTDIDLDIDIHVDEDSALSCINLDEAALEADNGEWLESVEEMFEGIATTPRSVKFGSEVDLSDAQSHYDLGVAFKEMGLYDEAINEFRQASDDPARKVACQILQAACLREKGDIVNTENLLRALLKTALSLEDACSVKYDLALTCKVAGKNEEATALLAEIDAAMPNFRDAHSRLDAAKDESSISFSSEDIDSFELK